MGLRSAAYMCMRTTSAIAYICKDMGIDIVKFFVSNKIPTKIILVFGGQAFSTNSSKPQRSRIFPKLLNASQLF
jgi:hypothetical protein